MNRTVLAFDTSGPYCAAALMVNGAVYAVRYEEMVRGQAERLMPMLEELLSAQNRSWPDVTHIGVGVGPGNFTGIRISVSAARGLALGLKIPAIGVSAFDAIALHGGTNAAVPAPRDMAYLVTGSDDPVLCPADAVPRDAVWPPKPEVLITDIAALANTAQGPFTSPAPLYVRAADAAPARDTPPAILNDT